MLFVRPDKPIRMSTDTPDSTSNSTSVCHAWAYIGSANLSESAWYVFFLIPPLPTRQKQPTNHDNNRGRLVIDRDTKKPKLNCRNWECGVLVPITSQAESEPEPEPAKKDKGKDKSTPSADSGPGPAKQDAESESATALDIFRGKVPVPMRMPGRRYEGTELRPWFMF